MKKKYPWALPAILGITKECPTREHESHVVCGTCHEEMVDSLRRSVRLLRHCVISLAIVLFAVSVSFLALLFWGVFAN